MNFAFEKCYIVVLQTYTGGWDYHRTKLCVFKNLDDAQLFILDCEDRVIPAINAGQEFEEPYYKELVNFNDQEDSIIFEESLIMV